METAIIENRSDLALLQPEWDRLASGDQRDGLFRTFAWNHAWLKQIRADADPFVIAVRNSQGRLIGLAPFCRLTYKEYGFRLKAVGFAGREVVSGEYLDILTGPETRAATVAAVLEALSGNKRRWGLLMLGELFCGGDLHTAAVRWAKASGLGVREQEERICPFIELPETFDAYLAGLSSATRYHIRRRTRELLQKNAGQIEIWDTPAQMDHGVELLTRLHLARWRKDGLPGTLGRPGFGNFLREFCRSLPEGASARFYVLRFGGEPAGVILVFHYGAAAYYYQAGWNPELPSAQLSPGVVLIAHSIEDAICRRLRYYDFLRGDEEYKMRFTRSFRKTITLLFGNTPPARSYLAAMAAKDTAKHWVDRIKKARRRSTSRPPGDEE